MEMEQESLTINPDTERIVYSIFASIFIEARVIRKSDEIFMGDTVFNTYEEAEARLRKMEEEEENIEWDEEEDIV